MPVNGVLPGDGLVGAAANASAPHYLQVVADFSQAAWNTVGLHSVFCVSGYCRIRFWAEVTEVCSSSELLGTFEGFAPTSICNPFTVEDLSAGSLIDWVNSTASTGVKTADAVADYILSSVVSFRIAGEAFSGGKISFHCVWEPMTPGATVTAGDGSAPA